MMMMMMMLVVEDVGGELVRASRPEGGELLIG